MCSTDQPTWWFRRISGDLRASLPHEPDFLGAAVSEEMGLGKTIEMIALILFHTPVERNAIPPIFNTAADVRVKPVKVRVLLFHPSMAIWVFLSPRVYLLLIGLVAVVL